MTAQQRETRAAANKSEVRAPRFPLHVRVRYRPLGATDWNVGRIENISRSGVLFWTERLLPVETPLELLFVLPLGDRAPGVVCRGRIVRSVLAPSTDEAPGLAASISSYRFVRGRAASV